MIPNTCLIIDSIENLKYLYPTKTNCPNHWRGIKPIPDNVGLMFINKLNQ